MTTPLVIHSKIRFDRVRHGHKVLRIGVDVLPRCPGRVPRVARAAYRAVADRRSWFGKLVSDAAKARADERIAARQPPAG